MNPRLRDLIQQLGEAIHESVVESEQIAGVVQNIRRHGFDVMLMLEATIGLNDVASKGKMAEPDDLDEDDPVTADSGGPFTSQAGGSFTSHDVNFLKSLRISVEGEE
jgi:hypothetical protein